MTRWRPASGHGVASVDSKNVPGVQENFALLAPLESKKVVGNPEGPEHGMDAAGVLLHQHVIAVLRVRSRVGEKGKPVRHRELLGGLARAAWERICELMVAAAGEESLRPEKASEHRGGLDSVESEFLSTNDDGFRDLVVGVEFEDQIASDGGGAHVIYGAANVRTRISRGTDEQPPEPTRRPRSTRAESLVCAFRKPLRLVQRDRRGPNQILGMTHQLSFHQTPIP